jgi:uncharacterized protein YcfL
MELEIMIQALWRIMKSRMMIWITILVCVCATVGCEAPLHDDVTDEELLILPSDFPKDYVMIDYSETLSDSDGQVSGAYMIMTSTRVNVIARGGEKIYRYNSQGMAAYTYQRFQIYIQPTARATPIPTPDGFYFSSTFADQWVFGCTSRTFQPSGDFADVTDICVFLAQYDEFFIFFTITIKTDGVETIKMENVNKILKAIDDKMIEKLR